MYLETRDVEETMKIYSTAWEKGVKSTYYLHMKPRHTAEQSTTSVNKSAKMGRVGFGALNFSSSPAFASHTTTAFYPRNKFILFLIWNEYPIRHIMYCIAYD
jgi:ribonucleoside-diphosphate reductase alpha chain